MEKEASDKLIIILIVIAIVISITSTYLVYNYSNNIKPGNIVINSDEPKTSTGTVGLVVAGNPNQKEGDVGG